jgi:hypothetical protein
VSERVMILSMVSPSVAQRRLGSWLLRGLGLESVNFFCAYCTLTHPKPR